MKGIITGCSLTSCTSALCLRSISDGAGGSLPADLRSASFSPLGVNLFVAMGIANVSLEESAKAVVPYIVVLTLATVLLTAVPQISLWLPRLLR